MPETRTAGLIALIPVLPTAHQGSRRSMRCVGSVLGGIDDATSNTMSPTRLTTQWMRAMGRIGSV